MNMLTSRIGTTFQNEAQIKSFFYPKWDFYNYFSIQRRIYLRPEFNDREITKIKWKKEKEKKIQTIYSLNMRFSNKKG